MKLDSVRSLKAELFEQVIAPAMTATISTFALSSTSIDHSTSIRRGIALGISNGDGDGDDDFRLAVRVQRRTLRSDAPLLEHLRIKAAGEIDIRYIGRVGKLATPWYQQRQRPLRIGSSVGHHKITAGTLGAFVRDRQTGQQLMLSNNHVLANEDAGQPGDAIWQPGRFDGGTAADTVGALLRAVKFSKTAANFVDVAVATIADGIQIAGTDIEGLGPIAGLRTAPLAKGTAVAKLGRTTGLRRGRVTATEIDNLVVGFLMGELRFDDQIEIEGGGTQSFSAGGDSGSLIVDAENRACGLLFAGGDRGGSNDTGLTYANPIKVALDAIKADLAL
jgi:hypothetical protein